MSMMIFDFVFSVIRDGVCNCGVAFGLQRFRIWLERRSMNKLSRKILWDLNLIC